MNPRRFLYLGLLIAALIAASCAPAPALEPTAKPTPLPPTDTPAPTATTEVPTPATSEGEVAMGFTEDGLPYRGNPNAPVTLSEHSEFQ
jgi:hypothetical protein